MNPPDPDRRASVRSFVLRAGRMGPGQVRALKDWGPRYLLPYAAQPLDLDAAFGRRAPRVRAREGTPMKLDLEGKVALVTGGSRGIGLACAEALLAAGALPIAAQGRTAGYHTAARLSASLDSIARANPGLPLVASNTRWLVPSASS